MNDRNSFDHPAPRRVRSVAGASALAVALTLVAAPAARADRVTPPPVPTNILVEGQVAFLEGHATGTQNYVCQPSGSGFVWSLFTPQATLFSDNGKQVTTHFFSPNPDENGTPVRAAWQHSRDTSTVWARVAPDGSSIDPAFVAPGAIPWLKLEVVGTEEGPTGGDKLTQSTFIQRLNTLGGVAPSDGCAQPADVGKRAFVPYRADYFFYRAPRGDDDEDDLDN